MVPLRIRLANEVLPSARRRALASTLLRAMQAYPSGSIGSRWFSAQYAMLQNTGSVLNDLIIYKAPGQYAINYDFVRFVHGDTDLKAYPSEGTGERQLSRA